MKTKHKIALLGLLVIGGVSLIALLIRGSTVAVLSPGGSIAAQQRDLMIIVTLMMLLIVIPVFVMTFMFAWKYRASNTSAEYKPTWDHSRIAETVWWGIPLLLISVLSVIIWISSHHLDPYRPLASDKKPITIQVVALQWKWLFIYPEQNIATVNYVQFPESTPVNFELTADAPMNSFWIPQLGGQVYAMTGMNTKLHLIANKQGTFNGASANLSGDGFADMKFTAKAVSQAEFDQWVRSVKQQPNQLTLDRYNNLAEPSVPKDTSTFSASHTGLYDTIISKYTMPESGAHDKPITSVKEQTKAHGSSDHGH